MTRLELAKLQLSRVQVQPRCNGARWHYMGIVIREKNRLIEIGLWENAAAGLEPFWAAEPYPEGARGEAATRDPEALEDRGPRNEDPPGLPLVPSTASRCSCKGCTGESTSM